jgi:hypothetical protein
MSIFGADYSPTPGERLRAGVVLPVRGATDIVEADL